MLHRVFDFLIKTVVSLLLLAVATLPLVYYLGHEPQHRQAWSDGLSVHADREVQVEMASEMRLSNVYLKEKGKQANWKQVEETFGLADYVSHRLSESGRYVVRKNLGFKEPKGKK